MLYIMDSFMRECLYLMFYTGICSLLIRKKINKNSLHHHIQKIDFHTRIFIVHNPRSSF